MAAVSSRSLVARRGPVEGWPTELEKCHLPCSLSGNCSRKRVLERFSAAVGVSSLKGCASLVAANFHEGRSTENNVVFKSTQDADDVSSFDPADIVREIADLEMPASAIRCRRGRQPPRFATLRAFGAGYSNGVVASGFEGTSMFELMAANIEATKQVKNWEVLSGRMAMLAISVAFGVELVTGEGVFEGVDLQKLEAVAALCAVASLSAVGFAYAWRAKTDVVDLMAMGYTNMVESALDNLVDGLFFEEH